MSKTWYGGLGLRGALQHSWSVRKFGRFDRVDVASVVCVFVCMVVELNGWVKPDYTILRVFVCTVTWLSNMGGSPD